ncbi:protein FAM110A [Callorhinchus milii]|uniref:protein FAM110A n=1 Tax=Callorhinchus milii TaxID=7868 RepID=UPI0004574060|nr:protein FAM110A [Callorhinchus milii]|eukprot:gi/632986366/ref/XP_007910197.1/ PREDICTED: protein FAM110A [Callorhinchus milii]
MPTDRAPSYQMFKAASGAAPSAMPLRLLNKGPSYFRRQQHSPGHKPSAVERLEADKAKYVKSRQVASTRQEPVKPVLGNNSLWSPTLRLLNSPSNSSSRNRRGISARKGILNLEILNNLINISDSPVPLGSLDSRVNNAAQVKKKLFFQTDCEQAIGISASSLQSPTLKAAVRRVDVRPNVRGARRPFASIPSPASPDKCTSPSLGSRSPTPRAKEPVGGSARRQASLHRSKSDLSDKFTRANADLERFFNYCGLGPEEIENVGMERFARATSDIVSTKLASVSSPSSGYARSNYSCAAEETLGERAVYVVSIIERNARVIKWLYGCRQAKESPKASPV